MKEKSPQEEKAAIRQVQLINEALANAKGNGGVWLNHAGMPAPRDISERPYGQSFQRPCAPAVRRQE